MENHLEKETTSRRSFAKSIAAMLAAVPLASTLVNAQGRQKPPKKAVEKVNPSSPDAAQRTTEDYDIRNAHDTPPPVLLMEGSCIVEIDAAGGNVGSPVSGGVAGRSKQIVKPNGLSGNIYLAHVKIVDGSGEMLYRLDNLHKDSVVVALALSNQDVMTVSAVGNNFEVEIQKGKKIGKKLDDVSMNKDRRARFRYMNDPSGGDEPDIKGVKVTKKGLVVYNVEFSDLKSKGKELKVMIWWED